MTYVKSDVPLSKKPKFVLSNGKKTKPELMARSLRALAMILRVGESEARALEISGEQFKRYSVGKAYLQAAQTMRHDGATFKTAMLSQDVFPRTVRELIDAAPTANSMHTALTTAARLVQQSQDVKKKIGVALIQPGFMMGMALIFLFVASATIIPGLIKSFATLNAKTPPMALAVVSAANIAKWVVGGIIAVIVLALLFWLVYGRKSQKVRILIDSTAIRLPLIGSIIQLAATSRLFELLAANLKSGRGEPAALESAGAGCGNEALHAHCLRMAALMRTGGAQLSDFAATKLMPLNARYMMGSAPSIKQQIDIMNELSPEYRKEADQQLEAFTRIIEPVSTYIVYAVAGLLIIAVIVPMYAMFPAIMAMDPSTAASSSAPAVPTP